MAGVGTSTARPQPWLEVPGWAAIGRPSRWKTLQKYRWSASGRYAVRGDVGQIHTPDFPISERIASHATAASLRRFPPGIGASSLAGMLPFSLINGVPPVVRGMRRRPYNLLPP